MGARDRSKGGSAAGAKKHGKHSHTPKHTSSPGSLGKRRAAEDLPRPNKIHNKNTQPNKHVPNKPSGKPYDATKRVAHAQHAAAAPQAADRMLSRKERKEISHAKQAASKKNFSLIQTAIQQWERARPKATSEDDRRKLVADLVMKVKGKVMELANHHSASRVIQFCLKHGSTKDKQTVMGEIKPHVLDLARSKYGHYLARKIINIASKEEVPGLVKLFRGQVVALSRHPYATDVLMDLYDVASTSERNAMRAEFYGREYALFDGVQTQASSITGPQQLLEGAAGSKRKAIFQHMYKSLMPIMEKALLHPPMVHRLLRDFLHAAPTSLVEDAVDTLCQTGGEVFKMVHTHEGAEAVCMLLAYGSAKDRRHLLKGMKGYVREITCNEWGHAAMCTAVSCVDDTTLLKKIVIQELQSVLSDVIEHKHGCKVLLHLLSPDNPRYMPPHILSMLHPPTRITTTRQAAAANADFEAQLHGEQDFNDGGNGADDMEEDGDFGGLSKVGSKKKKLADGKPAPAAPAEDEDEDEEDGEGVKDDLPGGGKNKKQKRQLFEDDDEDEEEDGEDEEEEKDGVDEEEDGLVGGKQDKKTKWKLFENGEDEEEDEEEEDDDDDEEEGEDGDAAAPKAKGKKGGGLKELPWDDVEGLLAGDDEDEDEDTVDQDEDEDEEDGMEHEQLVDGSNAAEGEGARVPVVLGLSRKDAATRRRELLSGGKACLAQLLCNSCSDAASDFLRHPVTSDLVVEVCRGGCDGLLADICPKGVAAVHAAVLKEITQPATDDQIGPAPGPAQQDVLQDYYGSRALRRLILHAAPLVDSKHTGGSGAGAGVQTKDSKLGAKEEENDVEEDVMAEDYDVQSAAEEFVAVLWEQALKGKCKQWFGSHADKVLSAFVFVKDEDVRKAALKELKGLVEKGDVMKWAQTFVRGDAVATDKGNKSKDKSNKSKDKSNKSKQNKRTESKA